MLIHYIIKIQLYCSLYSFFILIYLNHFYSNIVIQNTTFVTSKYLSLSSAIVKLKLFIQVTSAQATPFHFIDITDIQFYK